MKRAINIFGIVLALIFIAPAAAFAQEATSTPETATTTPETTTDETATTTDPTTHLTIEGMVDVPATCEVTDTDGTPHTYLSAYLGICALDAALESGLISSVGLSNQFPEFGLFVVSINDVVADPSSQYWALYQNGDFALSGVTSLPVAAGDTIELQLHDFSNFPEIDLGDRLTLHIGSLIATTTATTSTESGGDTASTTPEQGGGGGGGGGGGSGEAFDVSAAIAYLAGEQNEDGSFDALFLSDWAALAFASSNSSSAKTALKEYLQAATPDLQSVTDYERHAMALMALGINPYTGAGEDYLTPIVEAFDGTQIGEADLDNDDIFALFPLLHAGYDTDDDLVQKTVAFIIARQQSNGSWDGGVDITAAAIQALTLIEDLPGVPDALQKAEAYLRGAQGTDGGFGNSFSTSWTLQAIAALGDSPGGWSVGGVTPEEYLASLQEEDGGVEPTTSDAQTRLWATIYAIPGVEGKTWDSLLKSFSKPRSGGGSSSGSSSREPMVLGAATSTLPVATSTPPTASSTPVVLPVIPSAPPTVFAAPKAQAAEISLATVLGASAPAVRDESSRGILGWLWGVMASFFTFIIHLL